MSATLLSSFWLPEEASTVASHSDGLFLFITYLSYFFFFLITILMIVFVIKYRHRKGQPAKVTRAGHSTTLELTWTIIPTVLVIIIYIYGFRGYLMMAVEPPDAMNIEATGRMWSWSFTYPNGHVDNELHVPLNVPVRVTLNSSDVIHSLYFPAFRVKKDVVPGRFNHLWFQATQPGEYPIWCAAYCGMDHSVMRAKVVVEKDQASYEAWLAKASNDADVPPLELGERLYHTRGCNSCHTIDGGTLVGPTWKDMYGSTVAIEGGGNVVANDDYIKESIQFPAAKIVKGFTNQMPSFGDLKEHQIRALITYMKSISQYAPKEPASQPATRPTGASATPATGPANVVPAAH